MREGGFHSLTVSEVERHFGVDFTVGQSQKRALSNLLKYGPNSFEQLKENGVWRIFLRQFVNFFIILLLAAAVISYFVDGVLQAVILIVIAVINVLLGFFQENKAERALQDLKKSYQARSRILRQGEVMTLPNEELTLGDVVILESGDKVPADLRLIEEESLRVDESVLTGESVPVSKSIFELSATTPLADRRNMLYASTHIAAGRGRGIVIAVGEKTEFGRIAHLIQSAENQTPLEKQILYLGKYITLISLLVALIVFVLGVWRGAEIWSLLTFTIALLVAAVPESLPTAITLSLAVGVARMARRKAIVRRLAAIETLGAVNIIATDKTGTLTDNRLTADTISLFENGKWTRVDFNQNKKIETKIINFFVRGILCCDIKPEDAAENIGDPVEIAIVQRAMTTLKSALPEAQKYHRLFEIPFDSDKKYMAVLVRGGGRGQLIIKGMPERIIGFCSLNQKERKMALEEAAALSRQGFKVIALAVKDTAVSSRILHNMRLLGFFALVDEPATGVREAILQARKAGLRPIIITGDHPETARYIAQRLGLEVLDDEIIDENKLKTLSAKEFLTALNRAKIFARVTPEDKIRITKTLQELGYIVAVTGDGVNDAPALKEADVGVAMGIKGTDVARSSADIVLADDHYKTIVAAIEYGRTIFDNIKNVIVHLLSGNLNEISLVGLAYLLGLPAPITTLQILWVNLVTDSFPALALSFEHPSAYVLREQPRSASIKSLRQPIFYAGYLSIISFILCLVVYLWGLSSSALKAQTLTFTFFVFIELAFCFSLRSKKRIWQSPKSFFENRYLIAALLFSIFLQLILFLPPLNQVFGLSVFSFGEVAIMFSLIMIAFLSAELVRWLVDNHQSKLEKRERR